MHSIGVAIVFVILKQNLLEQICEVVDFIKQTIAGDPNHNASSASDPMEALAHFTRRVVHSSIEVGHLDRI